MKVRSFLKPSNLKNIKISKPLLFENNGIKYFFHSCKIEAKDTESTGFGVSRSFETSKNKAIMEAVERLWVPRGDCSYNGSAANFFSSRTQAGAKLEALERDVYIRWALGLTGHEIRVQNDTCILRIQPVYKDIEVVIAAQRGFDCVPFGLAAASTFLNAREHAFEELTMSLIRHRIGDCSKPQNRYQILHRATCNKLFHEKIFEPLPFKSGPILKVPHFIFNSYGAQVRWPLKVITASSPNLFIWDLSWFRDTHNTDHPNANLFYKKFGTTQIQTDQIFVG